MAGSKVSKVPRFHCNLFPMNTDISYSINSPLGRGPFGTVFKGHYGSKSCAVKLIKIFTASELRNLEEKSNNLKRLEHENIVRHWGCVIESSTNWLVIAVEMMEMSLKQYLDESEGRTLPFELQRSLCLDVAKGLEFLHSRNIHHRDLCCRNILLSKSASTPTAKITDYQLSTLLPWDSVSEGVTKYNHKKLYYPSNLKDICTEHARYGEKLDIYSFGIIAAQVLKSDFEMVELTWELVSNRPRDLQTHRILTTIAESHVMKGMVRSCLSRDRSERPSASILVTQITNCPRGMCLAGDFVPSIKLAPVIMIHFNGG